MARNRLQNHPQPKGKPEGEARVEELQQALSQSKREADALRGKISEMESSTEDAATEGSEESEVTDSEDASDSEEAEPTESHIQSQITDQ